MFHVKHVDNYTNILYKLALKSFKNGDIPVGCIILYDNKIIGKGYNNRQSKHFVCGHAEINAIKVASKKIHDWRLNNCILISTLKPCDMCFEVIKASRIKEIYYLMDQDNTAYNTNLVKKIDIFDQNTLKIQNLFQKFFKNLR